MKSREVEVFSAVGIKNQKSNKQKCRYEQNNIHCFFTVENFSNHIQIPYFNNCYTANLHSLINVKKQI